jgi:epoxyqueuosine reductase
MGRVTPAERTRWVSERAQAVGFDLCGVAQANTLAEISQLRERIGEWLTRGYAGEMKYLGDPRRSDPRLVLGEACSLIVVALNYNSAEPYSTECAGTDGDGSLRGWISRYAWGDDYHEVIRDKLETLLAAMQAEFEQPFEARAYVDTGPIVERAAAKYAGLGWLAKNTCLINEERGSWLFLGVIVTTLDLAPSLDRGELPPADLCGNCTLCLDACPTQAFPAPYVLDARRCISYLTIELRGAIPEDLRAHMGRAVFGCDICQDVCPWNRKAPITMAKEFTPRELAGDRNSKHQRRKSEDSLAGPGNASDEIQFSMFLPELESLASLSQRDFSEVFRRSAVKRAKWRGLVRNACVALGNRRLSRDAPARPRAMALLERLASSDDALIAEHASWALERLSAAD